MYKDDILSPQKTAGDSAHPKNYGHIKKFNSGNYSSNNRNSKPVVGNQANVTTAKPENKTGADLQLDNLNKNRDYSRNRKQKFATQPQAAQAQTKKSGDVLKIIPLGGCEEVGRNMTVFEYKKDIVILDMGIQFPEEDMPGIDYIIPNAEYLKGKEQNIRGVIFSHGHLDHIGAAPIILEKIGNPPIVGREMTIAMVKHRQEDYRKDSSKKLKTILIKSVNDRMKLGEFSVSFFQIEHSIRDAVGVILQTPVGTIMHPGDWTMEKDEQGQPIVDYSHLAKLPSPRILMLESLGAINLKESISTQEIQKNLTNLVTNAVGRTIIGTFSSQTERIGWILQMSEKLGKKVALDGYSMKMNVEIAQKLGYIKVRKETLIGVDKIDDYPDNKIVILCTGAQGEGNAVLSRIIDGDHRNVKLRKNDTVILSSSIIPGNERTIQRLKDNLYRQCDNVIHSSIMDVHVSGHGNKDDIVRILKQVQPDYFIPVYANHYMLKEAAKLARDNGYNPARIFVPDNGQVIEFDKQGGRLTNNRVPADYIFVDGLGITDSNNVVLRDRKMMAEDGMLVVIATINAKTGQLIHNPDLISRGFVYMKENKKLIEMTRQKVKGIIKDSNPLTALDDKLMKDKIRNEIGKFLYQKTEKRPMILPVIIEV